jgi:hypothetical protein
VPKKIYDDISVILSDKGPSSAIKDWVAGFRTGHLSTADERSGRPAQATVPEHEDVVHSMILGNGRVSVKDSRDPGDIPGESRP